MRYCPGRALVATAFAAVMVTLSPVSVEACTCGPSDCRSVASYDAVFEATVDAVVAPPARPVGARPPSPPLTVRLSGLRAIRGEARSQVVTAPSTASCGYRFTVGTRYLIFAMRDPENGELRVVTCGLTQPLARAAGLLGYVDSLAQPSRGGRLWGRAVEPRSDTAYVEPLRSATVLLTGEREVTTTTTPDGDFEFIDLPAGSYELNIPNLASRPELSFPPRTVTLAGDRACADVFMFPRIDSLIDGQVLDQDDRPISGVLVTMASSTSSWGTRTDEGGRFRIGNVPAGRYTASIRLDPARLGLASLEPGRSVIEMPFDLASGGHLTLEPVRLRRVARLQRVLLEGRVVTTGGAVVRGLDVWITALDDATAKPSRTWTLSDGTFAMPVITGRRYRIEIGDPQRPLARVEVTASDQPVTLSIAGR